MDLGFAQLMNDFLRATNGFFTSIFKGITLFGNYGIGFIILGLILLLFKKTRKAAFCMLLAFLIGYISFELILKNVIKRPRPFSDTTSVFYSFWLDAGGLKEHGYSFPSGHTTVAMEFGIMMFWFGNKKYSWIYFLVPIVMGMTRTYFMVHYITDVLGGILAGSISAIIALLVNRAIQRFNWYQKFIGFPNYFLKSKSEEE